MLVDAWFQDSSLPWQWHFKQAPTDFNPKHLHSWKKHISFCRQAGQDYYLACIEKCIICPHINMAYPRIGPDVQLCMCPPLHVPNSACQLLPVLMAKCWSLIIMPFPSKSRHSLEILLNTFHVAIVNWSEVANKMKPTWHVWLKSGRRGEAKAEGSSISTPDLLLGG